MRRPWNERYAGWALVACAIFFGAMAAALAALLEAERPYPCRGRHNCEGAR